MGNVQSGKTANFAGVIAKAADAGYRMVIVLAGMHNNLRKQTQARLDRDVFPPDRWQPLTTLDKDFQRQPLQAMFQNSGNMKLAAVVKKNEKRLANLVQSLRAVPEDVRQRFPILIVDDEADQATPNTKRAQQRVSAINKRLKEIWGLIPTGSYLAYTATPFANVLIDPDESADLFPSDFITTLTPGAGYFGPEQVFGLSVLEDKDAEGPEPPLDMVRLIPTAEAASIKPSSKREDRKHDRPPATQSLRTAISWFVIASAIRRARSDVGHSSMLIHTTHFIAPHFAMKETIEEVLGDLKSLVEDRDMESLRRIWEAEKDRVSVVRSETMPDWSKIIGYLLSVLNDIRVIVDNGESSERLEYEDDKPATVIAVGGGTLARGLTLEGLSVSYFTRTSNTYDTLLQMGRWFGYRPRYEDLPRIWVTEGLDEDYAHLARVEMDLRDEIDSLRSSEYSPAQLGVRVRTHPGRLEITAASKMFGAKTVKMSYSGQMNQAFLVDCRRTVQQRNKESIEELLAGASLQASARPGHLLSRGIDAEKVARFLNGFQHHPKQTTLAAENSRGSMVDWVRRVSDRTNWNVVVVSKDGRETGPTVEIGGHQVVPLDRRPLKASSDVAAGKLNFKAVLSNPERLADLDFELSRGMKFDSVSSYMDFRHRLAPSEGLVLIYPLNGRTTAKTSSTSQDQRMDLDLDHSLWTFAIVFPWIFDDAGHDQTFVSVRYQPAIDHEYDHELEDEEDEYQQIDDHEGDPVD